MARYIVPLNAGCSYNLSVPFGLGRVISVGTDTFDVVFTKDSLYIPLVLEQIYLGKCFGSDTLKVNAGEMPKLVIDPLYANCLPYQLPSPPVNTAGMKFLWKPGRGLSDSTIVNPVFGLKSNNTYTLYYSNSFGCTDSAKVDFHYQPCPIIPDSIMVYDAFSPTASQGKNDFLEVSGLTETSASSLEVYNRWGKKVYSGSPYKNDWDGKDLNGTELPLGFYYYIFNYTRKNSGLSKTLTGTITLIKD